MADEWVDVPDEQWVDVPDSQPAVAQPPKSKSLPKSLKVGAGETYVNHGINAVPLGKPATDIGSTAFLQARKLFGLGSPGIKFTEDQKQRMQAAGLWRPEFEKSSIPGPLDTYRMMRDSRNERTAVGAEQNPWAARLGTGTGVLASAAVPFTRGAELMPMAASRVASTAGPLMQAMGRIGAAAETGAGYGSLFALSNGKADLTRGELGQAAQDVAGIDAWKGAVDNYTKRNYGRAALDVLGAGAPGGAIGGALVSGGVEGVRNLPGLASGVENFANRRAVKATEPDLAHYRMLEKQGRLNEVGSDLLENKVVTPLSSARNIADRATEIRDQRGASIGSFLDNVDNQSYVDQRQYPIMAAKHGTVTEPVTTQRHVGWDMTPENQTQHVGHTSFDESVITPKAITENVTEHVSRPATFGYEPQVATENWIRQGFNADEAAQNIERQLMPQYKNKMGRSELASTISSELENLRADNPRTFSAANDLKSGLSDAISWTNRSEAGKNALLKQIRGAFNGEMERQAEAMLKANNAPPETMAKYLEDKRLYGNMATAAESAEDALLRRDRNRFFSPSDHGIGMTATLAAHPLAGVPAMAANKIMREFGSAFSASSANALAKALRSEALPVGVGRYVPAMEQSAMSRVGAPAFADLLDEDQMRQQQAKADVMRRR